MYLQMDRKDLALDLRSRLGDWLRVVNLLQTGGGDDVLVAKAWHNIGEYYMDRYKWYNCLNVSKTC
jgi:WD repeat-containing protein 35